MEKFQKIALLIDAENAQAEKLGDVVAKISSYGHIGVRLAFGDWSKQSLKPWKDELLKYAVTPVQRFNYVPKKNIADIALVISAANLAQSGDCDAFVIVASDSGYVSLVIDLRGRDKYVIGVGKRALAGAEYKLYRSSFDEFLFLEDFGAPQKPAHSVEEPHTAKKEDESRTPKKEAAEAKGNVAPEKREPEHDGEILRLLNEMAKKQGDADGWVYVSAAGNFIKRRLGESYAGLAKLIAEHKDKYELRYEIKGAPGKKKIKIYSFRIKK